MTNFRAFWQSHFNDAPPLGFALRETLPERWVRFHSLPMSKRYPETDDEHRIVLDRANAIAQTVLGQQADCWLVQAGDTGLGWPDEAFAAREGWRLSDQGAFRYDETEWPVFAGKVAFAGGAFDELFLNVASDRAAPTLLMHSESGNVFAPYDGGIDIILANASEVSKLKADRAKWLSPRVDGL